MHVQTSNAARRYRTQASRPRAHRAWWFWGLAGVAALVFTWLPGLLGAGLWDRAFLVFEALVVMSALWAVPGAVRAGRHEVRATQSALGRRLLVSRQAEGSRSVQRELRLAWAHALVLAALGAATLAFPAEIGTPWWPWDGAVLLALAGLLALAAARAGSALRDA